MNNWSFLKDENGKVIRFNPNGEDFAVDNAFMVAHAMRVANPNLVVQVREYGPPAGEWAGVLAICYKENDDVN